MTPWVLAKIDGNPYRKSMSGAQARFDALLMHALKRTAELAASYAKQSRLYKSHTYGLRASIKGLVVGGMGGTSGGMPMARIMATAPYAQFVEGGTQAHYIPGFFTPGRSKILRFVQNGVVRFAKRVYHPGTKPRPFMQEARDRTMPIFERLVGEAFVRAFA